MVGWSFFLAGSSPPDVDGPTSTAIWDNCQVGSDGGALPTSSSHSASAILFIISSTPRGVCGAGDGGCTVMRAPSLSPLHAPLHMFLTLLSYPSLPSWVSPSF